MASISSDGGFDSEDDIPLESPQVHRAVETYIRKPVSTKVMQKPGPIVSTNKMRRPVDVIASSVASLDKVPDLEGSSARSHRKKRSTGFSSAANTEADEALNLGESIASDSRTRKERAGFDIVGESEDAEIERSEPLQHNSPAAGSSGHRPTNSSSNGDHMEVDELAPPEKNRVTGGSSSAKRRIPRILKGLHDEDIIATPPRSHGVKRRSDPEPSPPPSPNTKHQRLTRSAIQPRRVSYDMKFHPMDMELRPNAPATHRKLENQRVKSQEEDSDDEETDESQSLTTKKTRTTRQLGNGAAPNYDMTAHPLNAVLQSDKPSTRSVGSKTSKPSVVGQALDFSAASIATEWDELNDFDKRLYTLQGGAPDDSNYLPIKWSELARILVRDGFFTKQQLINQGGETKLKERYKLIRKGIQGKLTETEAKDKDNQLLYWLEDFDVYDMEVGAKEPYVHKNIPEYMRGIERFTLADLLRNEQEFKNRRKSLQSAKKDDADSGSYPVREESDDNATMNPSSSVAFQPTRAYRTSTDKHSTGRTTPSDMGSYAEFLREDLNPPSHDPDLSTEDVGHIINEHFSQEIPTNISLYGRSTCGSASESDLRSSPRGNGMTANVAPTATMVAPLTTAGLAIAAPEAFVSMCQRCGPEAFVSICQRCGHSASISGNSQQQVEQTPKLDVKKTEPSTLEILSNDASILNSPDNQLRRPLGVETELVEHGKETELVEDGKDATTQLLNDLSTKPLESQTIAGTTRRQLDRTKGAKRAKTPNITIHEDTPGNTPQPSRYRPHNSTANDIPKENIDMDEQDEIETAGTLLTGFGARGHAAQLRDRIERAATLLPGDVESMFTPASTHVIPVPVPVSRLGAMGGGGFAPVETDLEDIEPDDSGQGTLFAAPSRRVPVVYSRASSRVRD